jgi:pyruvate ferredoxin oxidoreductase beta subunit
LYEVVDGRYRLTYEPRRTPVEEWLRPQGRFSHLFRPENEGLISQIQEQVDSDWAALLTLCNACAAPTVTRPSPR